MYCQLQEQNPVERSQSESAIEQLGQYFEPVVLHLAFAYADELLKTLLENKILKSVNYRTTEPYSYGRGPCPLSDYRFCQESCHTRCIILVPTLKGIVKPDISKPSPRMPMPLGTGNVANQIKNAVRVNLIRLALQLYYLLL